MLHEFTIGSPEYWLWFRLVTYTVTTLDALLVARLAEKRGYRTKHPLLLAAATIVAAMLLTEFVLGELLFEWSAALMIGLLVISTLEGATRTWKTRNARVRP